MMLLQDFGLTKSVFLDKVNAHAKSGIAIKSDPTNVVVRAWTDFPNWQFSVTAIADEPMSIFHKVSIESIGESKEFLSVSTNLQTTDVALEIASLSGSFGNTDQIEKIVIQEFLDSYMESKFNRFLTKKLFEEYSHIYKNWIIN